MRRNISDILAIVMGALLLGLGLVLHRSVPGSQAALMALPYVCIGVGCGAFGHGMGNIIGRKALKNNPSIQKQMEIDKNDERNVAISNRAKAKAYDFMIFVFGALMVSFALMGVELVAVLLLVFAYLLVVGFSVYYHCKYNREM